MGWGISNFLRPIENLVDTSLQNVLGKDIGGFLGSGTLGKAIDYWNPMNPVTQVTANPIVRTLQGKDFLGRDWDPNWYQQASIDYGSKFPGILYGGAALSGLTGGGSLAGTTSGTSFSPYLSYETPFLGGTEAMGTDIPWGETLGSSPWKTAIPTIDTGLETAANTATGGGGWLSTLGNMAPLLALGALSNYGGNVQNAQQAQSNLQQYRQDATWTPERTQSYMSGLERLTGGIYGAEEERQKKRVSNYLSEAGRGGGAYAKAAEKLGREKREAISKALTQGQTVVSTPTNVNAGMYQIPSASGQTLTGLSGMAGNLANTYLMMQLLGGLKG